MPDTEEKYEDDNYKVPPGIILPKDRSADYPNWKTGIISGLCAGLITGAILIAIPLSESVIGRIAYGLLGLLMGFLLVGAIVAFRPPRD